MQARGHEPKPGTLHKMFNSRYEGRSVAFSTASKWLRGMALPEQDKLTVLAELFGVEPQVLRYGKAGKGRVAESHAAWPALGARERQVMEAFLGLPPKQRGLVGELIDTLANTKLSKP